jgi:DNA-binding response OmpR family regulator
MTNTKIFYVEDEPFLAKIVLETLQGSGYEVLHVSNGSIAFEKFQEFGPDICILDVMLPGKDGFSIGSEINKSNPTIPIIFLTAKDQTKDVVKGFTSGGNDYIKKPFSMEELMVRVENLLRLSNSIITNKKPKSVFKIGSLKFDPIKMELSSEQTVQSLSHRESEILSMLCENLNGKLDRRKILMQVWNDDSFFNSRNLDVYIRKIRKYLSMDTSVHLITLKGIGYRLVTD